MASVQGQDRHLRYVPGGLVVSDDETEEPSERLEFRDEDIPEDDIKLPPAALTHSTLDELQRIYDRDRKLTAEATVAEAADPMHPLHRAFEWDDQIAGHEYRLAQARRLIARVKVVVDNTPIRKFVNMRSTGSYEPVERVMSKDDLRAEALAEFRKDADRFRRKWQSNKLVADAYQAWLSGQTGPPTVQSP